MKKILISLITFLFGCLYVTAQIDRSKAPEGGPAPEIKLEEVTSFKLSNGLTIIIVENNKLPKVRASIYFDYQLVAMKEKAGLQYVFGKMLRAGTKKYSKETIDEESEYLGTALFTNSKIVGISALKRNLEPSLEILSEIVKNPTFDNENEFAKHVKQSLTSLEAGEKNPDVIMGRVYNALLYGKEHPYGEFETKQSLKNININDCKEFYDRFVNPKNSYLTFVGDITQKEAKKLAKKYFSSWKKSKIVLFNLPQVPDIDKTNIVLINLPSSTQANVFIAHTMDFKKTNLNYHALKLGNIILGVGSFGRLFKNIREDKGYTYGAYSQVTDDRYVGEFRASAKVRNGVVDSAISEFFNEFNTITSSLPSEEELNIRKIENTGKFALQLEKPETIGRFARTELIEKLDKGFYANYLKRMNAVSPEDVYRAMKEKIQPTKTTIFVVGKAEELLPRLKKLNYPISFYNIWAKKIAEPTKKKKVVGMNAMDIVEKYITAIGGREILKKKQTLMAKYDTEITGAPISFKTIEKKSNRNQKLIEIYMIQPSGDPNGTRIFKQVFDGEEGYIVQMGEKKVSLEEKRILDYKTLKRNIFPRLYYRDFSKDEISLEGIISYEGHEVYQVKIDKNDDSSYELYNTETFYFRKNTEFILRMKKGKIE